MKDRLGCLSASGVAVAGVLLLVILGWSVASAQALFSPGSLSTKARAGRTLGGVRDHASLSGDCAACHTAPWSGRTMAERCAACHQNVLAQIRSRKGLHGALVGGAASPTCKGCHTDHRGPGAALTVYDETSFPHDLIGYSLRGHARTAKGRPFVCADCHPAGIRTFEQATCVRCHRAIDAAFMARHEKAFGTECLPCHDGSGKGTGDFDHSRLPFKLTGKHAKVACGRCHTNGGSIRALRDTPTDCYACHAKSDKHAGRYGRQCGQCHTTAAWTGATFDHSVFPIDHGNEGGRQSACATCHPANVNAYTCYGCHEHTTANILAEHEGRPATEIADCIKCHKGGRKGDD